MPVRIASQARSRTVPRLASVVIAARDGHRPLVEVGGGPLIVTGGAGSSLTLSGLLFTAPLHIRGDLANLTIEHCTLAPGTGASLVIEAPATLATIDSCILGAVRVPPLARPRSFTRLSTPGIERASLTPIRPRRPLPAAISRSKSAPSSGVCGRAGSRHRIQFSLPIPEAASRQSRLHRFKPVVSHMGSSGPDIDSADVQDHG
jgi:hypothetical protein